MKLSTLKFTRIDDSALGAPHVLAIQADDPAVLSRFLKNVPDLKGLKGDKGLSVKGDPGRRGRRGERGLAPDHLLRVVPNGYELQFFNPHGDIGKAITIVNGGKGDKGRVGPRPHHETRKAAGGYEFRFQTAAGTFGPWNLVRQGDQGPPGPRPRHEWVGTRLRFEKPDGTFGELVDLRGPAGLGGGGGRGRSANPGYSSIVLNGTNLEFRRATAGPLGPDTVVDLSALAGGGGSVVSVVGGANVSVDATDAANPIVNLDGALVGVSVNGVTLTDAGPAFIFLNAAGAYVSPPPSGGDVDMVFSGSNIDVDNSDPINPVVNLDTAVVGISVNGVTLVGSGSAANFLDETGTYSPPPLDTTAADILYLRLDTANDPLTGELVSEDIVPSAGADRFLGLADNRFATLHSQSLNAVEDIGTGGGPTTIIDTNKSNLVGKVRNSSVSGASLASLRSTGLGSFANGFAAQNDANAATTSQSIVSSTGNGSFAAGNSNASAGGNALLQADGFGSTTFGYSAGFNGQATILSNGLGAFASGFSLAFSPNPTIISAIANGAFAQGSIITFGGSVAATITAAQQGSFAQGQAGTDGIIRAGGQGSFSQGTATSGNITANGLGSFAQGIVAAGTIIASGNGSLAHGSATGTGSIIAGGSGADAGALAVGSAAGSVIAALAPNAFQFGPGVNTASDSLQVGNSGVRFKGTVGAPPVLQNGDIWVSGGFVFVRSNGTSIQIAGPGPLTN